MPVPTAVFNRTLTNLGPLTTTFTPAPGCTALAGQTAGAAIFCDPVFDDNALPPVNGHQVPCGAVSCTPQDLASCYPNGKAQQSIVATDYEMTQPYHSPGYYCPAGWTAVGSAAFEVALAQATRTDLAVSDMPKGYDAFVSNFALALGPSETVTVCCPSGYKPFAGDFEVQIGCTSSMGPASSYGVSERCFNDVPTTTGVYWFNGDQRTKIEPVAGAPTSYIQLNLTGGTNFNLYHTMPNIVLVNKGPADASATPTPTPTPTATGKKGDKDDKDSGANGERANVPVTMAVSMVLAVSSMFLGLV